MNNCVHKVTIIGCGWVGTALAKQLIANNIEVIGTTTTQSRLAEISRLGAKAKLLDLSATHDIATDFLLSSADFNQSDVVVIAITPQFKKGRVDYPDKVKQILTLFDQYTRAKIILLSSSSIYNGLSGVVDETASLASNDKTQLLSMAEQAVLTANPNNLVLRLAGLVGPNRYPGKFFAGKTNRPNGQAWVNLVHQEDVVGAILFAINDNNISGIINVVSDTQATKAEFYRRACHNQRLALPTFVESTLSRNDNRRVSNARLKSLGYQLKQADLMTWLDETNNE